jgi:hypothetical protein
MERVNLYEEFERVFTQADHYSRESDTEQQHSPRHENRVSGSPLPAKPSYARRVLNLLRKPHEEWNTEDYAFAARAVEETRFVSSPLEQDPHHKVTVDAKRPFARDEFDRRLWGLPSRPHLLLQ